MAAPSLDIIVEPTQVGSLVYLPLAAGSSDAASNGQLSFVLRVTNNETSSVHVSQVTVAFAPPPTVPPASIAADVTIASHATEPWNHGTVNNIFLPEPAPSHVTIGVICDGYDDAATVTLPLVPYKHSLGGHGYRFPANFDDLATGEYWNGRSGSHSPAGGGVQLYGYDMDVVRFDAATATWTSVKAGGSAANNEHYLVWGKPIVAMADGTVQSWLDGKPTNPSPPADLSPPGPVEGNHFYIQHGDALVLYAHLQAGTLNPDLMVAGAAVEEGQQLGLAGNSGNSSEPHLHIHAIRGVAPWVGPPWPLPFRGLDVMDRSVLVPPDPWGPWSIVDGTGLPSVACAIHALSLRRRFRHHRYWGVAIDPRALVLPSSVYVRLTLPDPPPIEVLVEQLAANTSGMSAGDRKESLQRVKRMLTQLERAVDRAAAQGEQHG
jgi:hypothetical protein